MDELTEYSNVNLHQVLNLTSHTPVFLFPKLISEPVLPFSPLLSTSLLSEHVERDRDESGQERFRVRTLFHKWVDTSTRGTCITLHAFKETEEHKASCMTQVRNQVLSAYCVCLSDSFTSTFHTLIHPCFFLASFRAVCGNSDTAQSLV